MSQPQKPMQATRIEELQSKNPTELLREQVLLLREIRQALSEIKPQSNEQPEPIEVIVTDLEMSIWSMTIFMVRWVFASIPAAMMLIIVWLILSAILIRY